MKKILVFLVVVGVLIGVVGAVDTTVQLSKTGTAVSEFSDQYVVSGLQSVRLQADLITGPPWNTNEGRIRIIPDQPFTLNDLDTLSWEQYVEAGYMAHVDVFLDIDGNEVYDNADDVLVFEHAKNPSNCENIPYPTGASIDTFGTSGIVDSNAYAWLNSGNPGPGCVLNGPAGFYTYDLSDWKTGQTANGKTINGTIKILYFEIEVDGWIAESEAFIDDVMLNGVLVPFGSEQPVTVVVGDIIQIDISPTVLDFGAIPYGTAVIKLGSDVIVDTTGSDTIDDKVYVEIALSEDSTGFFTDLLDFEDEGVWTNLVSLPIQEIAEGDSETFGTRLSGNTKIYGGAGPKNAVITYTAVGPTP